MIKTQIFVIIFFAVVFSFIEPNDAVSQWVHITNPSLDGVQEWVTSFAEINGVLLAGSDGVFLSTDSGDSWITVNNGLGNRWVESLAVIGDTMYVGTYVGTGLDTLGSPIFFVSTNYGRRWVGESKGLPVDAGIRAFAICNQNLYAGMDAETGNDILFRTTNDGIDWNAADGQLNNSWTNYSVTALAAIGENLFAAVSNDGAFCSLDSGKSWNMIGDGLPSNAYINAFAVIGSNLFACISGSGIFRTTNNGKIWSAVNNGISDSVVSDIISSNGNLFACGGDSHVFLSIDSGMSWISVGDGLPRSNYLSLLDVYNGNLFAETDSGLWRRPLSDLIQSGVSENMSLDSGSGILVFPNPASNEAHLLTKQEGIIHVFDRMGRERLTAISDGTGAMLDVSHLEAGMYFLRLGNQSAKIEISHGANTSN